MAVVASRLFKLAKTCFRQLPSTDGAILTSILIGEHTEAAPWR